MRTTRHTRGRRARARTAAAATLLVLAVCLCAHAQRPRRPSAAAGEGAAVPTQTLLRIVAAEDERRWDAADLGALLNDARASVRRRAALAAGRIGDEAAVEPLAALMRKDRDEGVRATAAFALGEIESAAGADMLLTTLRLSKSPRERGRAVEALGKIAAALPQSQGERRQALGAAILSALAAEQKSARPNSAVVLPGLTAVLRARPEGGAEAVAPFLSSRDASVRADAANTLARLRAKTAQARLRALLASDPDPVVRANSARALGAAEDADSFDALAARLSTDADARVRVSAARALAQLGGERAAAPLLERAESLFASYRAAKAAGTAARPPETNELLELASALARLPAGAHAERALAWLRQFREAERFTAPEAEVAYAHIAPAQYVRAAPLEALTGDINRAPARLDSWQSYSAVAQGLAEIASASSTAGGNSVVLLKADVQMLLLSIVNDPATPPLALPDLLRALAAFRPGNLAETMRARLTHADPIVRATAADSLAELDPDPETARALADALPAALGEKTNDAALSILAALARQKTPQALDSVATALGVPDYVVRRRAAALLREAGRAGDARRETVATRNKEGDYRRALARVGRVVRARVSTEKGAFVIELLPAEAPLSVDNFVELARAGYFRDVAFHRVVPNFVVQGGDPRGDGNGGPGYQIRCEINTVPYRRGAVGMALSGKDTGGSQWFVTHSPQPHLDGGYTVFGRVVEGMDVVDSITRGDRIREVLVTEGRPPAARRGRP